MTKKKMLALALLGVSLLMTVGIIGSVLYVNDVRRQTPIVYSEKDMLNEMYAAYKREYIEPSTGRTIDKQRDNITTSEGQSYTMMRAVWLDDRATFDSSWQWAKDNLQRDDFLMSWKFGPLADGSYGIQTDEGGNNTASDGDSDIAVALLLAYSRWQEDDYLYDAKAIIGSIWTKQVVMIDGRPVPVANDLERNNRQQVIINPSYISPHAYKLFAQVDKSRDWKALTDNSYELLKRAGQVELGAARSSGLPPDWMVMDRRTGELRQADVADLKTTYGFDAIRTPWRLALDYSWFKDERSKDLLKTYSLLGEQWRDGGKIAAVYNRDGSVSEDYETPAAYGTAMGYFKVVDPATAAQIYRQKLSVLYDPDEQRPTKTLSYYDDNWAWFGTALYLNQLPNLTVYKEHEL